MKARYKFLILIALSCALGLAVRAQSSQPSAENGRRLLGRVNPNYPDAAIRIRLGGTVKVVAIVGTDGTVKKVEPVGGNPLLLQAAENAIEQWKYAPGPESRENVELRFKP